MNAFLADFFLSPAPIPVWFMRALIPASIVTIVICIVSLLQAR